MDNLNDTTPSIAGLDLSGIPGIEEYLGTPAAEEAVEPSVAEEAIVDTYSDAPEGPISWASISEDLPEPLHETLRPIVDEWSRKYERVREEAAPYYNLVDSGFTNEEIQMAAALQRALATDPEGFYDQMGQAYGYAQAQKIAQLEERVQQIQPSAQVSGEKNWWEDDDVTTPNEQTRVVSDPRIDQMEQELEQLRAMQEEVQEQQRLDEGRAQMEIELASIRNKYGEYNEEEVVRRAVANHHVDGDASLTRAFHEYKDMEARYMADIASKQKTAPKVMGASSGMVPSDPPAKLDTDEARRQAALELAIRLGATPPNGSR
jgi:hypothetical protein